MAKRMAGGGLERTGGAALHCASVSNPSGLDVVVVGGPGNARALIRRPM